MHPSSPFMRRRLASRGRQRGVVAIIVGLTAAVMLGFVGLALDGGHLYLTKTELQNGADACALAASYELTGAPAIEASSFARAEAAGIAVAGRNKVGFQGAAIGPGDVSITFSNSLGGGWVPAGGAPGNSKYVRCTVQRTGIAPWFMQLLGLGNSTVAAIATATLAPAQTNCGIPLGICQQGPAEGTPPFGLTPGQWINGRFDAGGGSTGSFNWIDYSPPSGGQEELGSLLRGNGQCNLNVPHPVGQSGIMGNAAARAWNTRFGLYQAGPDNVNTAPPDFSGYAYTATNWPSQANALADFRARRSANAPYGADVDEGNALTGLSLTNAYNPTTTPAQHQQYGADRRIAVAPIVDCDDWATSQTVSIRGWACILMLHPIASTADVIYMEYLGLANSGFTPCATSGIAGSSDSIGPMVPALVQ
jgi:hypothetical protein